MAHHKAAQKAIRQDRVRNKRNAARKSELKTRIKKVLTAVEAKDSENARKSLAEAIPAIDRLCRKGTIHKNNAARKKSQLTKKVRALSA